MGMNHEEAKKILADELDKLAHKAYEELIAQVGEVLAYEIQAPSNCSYQLEILILWDSKTNDSIRVVGSIDDGGWRAFCPLTDSILKLPPKL